MYPNPYIIASYPRSGSTWLRFILCNLLHPEHIHDFDSVNRLIPQIEDPEGMARALPSCRFYKTHQRRHAQRIVFLHRHVGDVLISEWWYKQKFHADTRTFEEFLVATDYGQGWRDDVDFYFPCDYTIGYRDLGFPHRILDCVPLLSGYSDGDIEEAARKSNFDQLQRIEADSGFGEYPIGDVRIRFIRKGTSDQWKKLPVEQQETILQKNHTQLLLLRYL